MNTTGTPAAVRTYRVRVLDTAGFTHVHDVTAASARLARGIAFASVNEETGNALVTIDIHGVTATGGFGVPYFRHALA